MIAASVLRQTITAAQCAWDSQKAAGATRAELVRNLEQTLRAAYPQTREWKYLCLGCRDYGLEMLDCPGDATCGRTKRHGPHEFGRPCWCSVGDRFRARPRTETSTIESAAKVKRTPTRWGK